MYRTGHKFYGNGCKAGIDMRESILELKSLSKNFTHKKNIYTKKHIINAVKDISLSLYTEESLGLVGESGCGKSTTANMILRLIDPTNGKIFYNGEDITALSEREMQKYRKDIQIIFQYSAAVLDPKMTIEELLTEPLTIHNIVDKNSLDNEVNRLLEMVGISPLEKKKFPSQLSGGQNQRIIIARAIATRPKVIVCDEPVSALDVSIQGQILNLLKKLKEDLKLTYIFISHDIKVVRFICDRIAVMYKGEIIEISSTRDIINNPQKQYTKILMSTGLNNGKM